jgi:hypothetical protein
METKKGKSKEVASAAYRRLYMADLAREVYTSPVRCPTSASEPLSLTSCANFVVGTETTTSPYLRSYWRKYSKDEAAQTLRTSYARL